MKPPVEKLTVEEIKARVRVVCICKGIKAGKVSDAIRSGCLTVEEVNKATGSGNGGCGATRCGPVIVEMLKNGGKILTHSSVSLESPEKASDESS